MTDREFWQMVYLAAIAGGKDSIGARLTADAGLKRIKEFDKEAEDEQED